jgi:dTDP-4-dehydrorhamnose 3,5-epimerase
MPEVRESETIAGVYLCTPETYGDERGYFVETYRRQWFPQGREMVQANRGDRIAGCLVGLHYHLHQADYWYVPFGTARVVLHDLRQGGPTDGATLSLELGRRADVAHGFASVTDMTITYLVDGYYNPADELGVAWDDPAIDADWGVVAPVLSERDRTNPGRDDLPAHLRPHWPMRT